MFIRYPKIKILGDKSNDGILTIPGRIVIQEKIDGGNFGFYVENNILYFCSHNQNLTDSEQIAKTGIPKGWKGIEPVLESWYNDPLVFYDNLYYYGECLSEDSEILTLDGWKNHNELNLNDELLTYNKEKNFLEYQKPEKINKYQYDGEMINIKSTTTDQLVTPNHRVLYHYDQYNSGWKVKEAINIPKGILRFMCASKYDGEEIINIDWLRLLAWVITEGSYEKITKRIIITQSMDVNPENVIRIRKLLHRQNIDYSFDTKDTFIINTKTSKQIYNFLNGKIHEIPKSLLQLENNLLKILFNEMIMGDGHLPKNSVNNLEYYTKSEQLRDQFQELCLKIGYRCNYVLRENRWGKWYSMRINKKSYTTFRQHKKWNRIVQYSGIVWCPTVKNGFIVVRRNGKMFITGNSLQKHTMTYDNIPGFIGFDILNINDGKFLNWELVKLRFEEMELPFIHTYCEKNVSEITIDYLKSLYQKSVYRNGSAEGIVIKRYDTQLMAKIVDNKFKEKNKKVFGGIDQPKMTDDIRITEMYATPARIEKIIYKLNDDGLEIDMPLMRILYKEVINDFLEEEILVIYNQYKSINFKILNNLVSKKCNITLKKVIMNQIED